MSAEKLLAIVDRHWPAGPIACTSQLAACGLEERVLTAAVRNGVLLRLRRGAYARSSEWNALKPWDRDRLLVWAHFESTGGTAIYSHVSAARLHQCHVWDAGRLVHVTTGYANSRTSAGIDVRTHRLPLADGDTTTLLLKDGRQVCLTSLERTVLDCARILPLEQAAVIGDHALNKGAGLDHMQRLLAQSPVKRGARRAALLLDGLDGRSESAGETRTRLLLRSFGLDAFVPQVPIATGQGQFRADFADPQMRLVIEFDGRGKYSDYRPTAEVLLAERARENALIEAGWLVLRVDWHQLARPDELRRRVLTVMARSRRQSA